MKDYIKLWYFTDNTKHQSRIEYHVDGMYFFYFIREAPIKYSLQSVLTYSSPIEDMSINVEIALYVAKHHNFEGVELTEKEEKHFRFWKYFDQYKLPILTCFPPLKNGSQEFLELSPACVSRGYFSPTNPTRKYPYFFRFDDLFFDGPELANLSLEDRKKIRLALLNALAPESGLSLKDAFPLFDYNKITPKRWEYSPDGGFSGEFLELEPHCFVVGGWSNPRDAGSNDFSIENIWKNGPNYVDNAFEGANEFIGIALKNALIIE